MFNHARHGAAEFAGLLRLLRGAGQVLLPFLSQFLALLHRQRRGRIVGALIRACLMAGSPLPGVGLGAATVTRLAILALRLDASRRLALMILRGIVRRRFIAPAALAAVGIVVIQVLVEGFAVRVVIQTGVDFLGAHVVVHVQHDHLGRRLQSVADEDGIDREVAGEIPFALDAVAAPDEVGQRTVQRLMRQHELDLGQRQAANIGWVVVEALHVRGGGAAPRPGRDHRQAQYQRPEEGLVEDQPRTGCRQFDGRVVGAGGPGGTR